MELHAPESGEDLLPEEVKGIPVGHPADVLFFLHAAQVTRPLYSDEQRRMADSANPLSPPEVMRYVLHYEDGSTATIPVLLGQHVEHWLAKGDPGPLERASVGWTARLGEGDQAKARVFYSVKVANPHPEKRVQALDILPGLDDRGRKVNRAVPGVVAITTGIVAQ